MNNSPHLTPLSGTPQSHPPMSQRPSIYPSSQSTRPTSALKSIRRVDSSASHFGGSLGAGQTAAGGGSIAAGSGMGSVSGPPGVGGAAASGRKGTSLYASTMETVDVEKSLTEAIAKVAELSEVLNKMFHGV